MTSNAAQLGHRAALAALLASATLAGAPQAWSATACDTSEKSPGITASGIKLGATMPLTGSAAAGGLGVSAGARAYYDMVNAAGGIQGHKISFTVLDDEYKPATAQQQMRALVQRDRVFAIAGGEGTPNFLAVAPLLEREKVPAIGPYAPSSELGTMKTPHIFMTAVTYITEFAIMTKYVMDTAHPQSLSLVGVQGNVGDDAKAGMEKGIGNPADQGNLYPRGAGHARLHADRHPAAGHQRPLDVPDPHQRRHRPAPAGDAPDRLHAAHRRLAGHG